MIFSADASAVSRSSVNAPVDRYFQPPSLTMKTMVPSIDLARHLGRSGHRGTRREAGEDTAFGDEPAASTRSTHGSYDTLAVEQVGAAPVLEHGRDVAVVEVAQPLDTLAERWLDGDDLDDGLRSLR